VQVSSAIQPRMPCVQAQMKAKKPLGGTVGSMLGYGGTRFSKKPNKIFVLLVPAILGQSRVCPMSVEHDLLAQHVL
jgi:hypothetical protein